MRNIRLAIFAALVVAFAAWVAWRHYSLGNVRNLHSRGTNVIAFGDSLTAGYGAQPGEDYPSRVSAATGIAIINAGVSGDTAMYKRVAKDEHCLFVSNVLSGILTHPELKSDEIHPNARGYQLMADRVAAPLQKLLRAAKR